MSDINWYYVSKNYGTTIKRREDEKGFLSSKKLKKRFLELPLHESVLKGFFRIHEKMFLFLGEEAILEVSKNTIVIRRV